MSYVLDDLTKPSTKRPRLAKTASDALGLLPEPGDTLAAGEESLPSSSVANNSLEDEPDTAFPVFNEYDTATAVGTESNAAFAVGNEVDKIADLAADEKTLLGPAVAYISLVNEPDTASNVSNESDTASTVGNKSGGFSDGESDNAYVPRTPSKLDHSSEPSRSSVEDCIIVRIELPSNVIKNARPTPTTGKKTPKKGNLRDESYIAYVRSALASLSDSVCYDVANSNACRYFYYAPNGTCQPIPELAARAVGEFLEAIDDRHEPRERNMKMFRDRVRIFLKEADNVATRNTEWVLRDLDGGEDLRMAEARSRLANAEEIIRKVRQSL
ncbi:hypothetical protein BR93DRAFT_973203 [Coniochaeta sp. PMI_546]|nr:hypothetical protein BR93DRAFT_973203 [Coniochaeta sp. PMI_546]